MRLLTASGEELTHICLAVDDTQQLKAQIGIGTAIKLDAPPLAVSLNATKEGLIIHVGFSEEEHVDVLIEHEDVKALKKVPSKGLAKFALKALR